MSEPGCGILFDAFAIEREELGPCASVQSLQCPTEPHPSLALGSRSSLSSKPLFSKFHIWRLRVKEVKGPRARRSEKVRKDRG